MTIIDAVVLSLYPAIIFFSCWVLWCFGVHLLWPAWKSGVLTVKDHALPIAIVLAAIADLVENAFYGFARVDHDGYNRLTMLMVAVGPMKTLILVGLVFAIAGYKKAMTGSTTLGRLFGYAFAIWCITFVMLTVK